MGVWGYIGRAGPGGFDVMRVAGPLPTPQAPRVDVQPRSTVLSHDAKRDGGEGGGGDAPYGDVWRAGHSEQAHVSTRKASSAVPFGFAVTSDWNSCEPYKEHSVKRTPRLCPQAIARALQVLHPRSLSPAKPAAVMLQPPPPPSRGSVDTTKTRSGP